MWRFWSFTAVSAAAVHYLHLTSAAPVELMCRTLRRRPNLDQAARIKSVFFWAGGTEQDHCQLSLATLVWQEEIFCGWTELGSVSSSVTGGEKSKYPSSGGPPCVQLCCLALPLQALWSDCSWAVGSGLPSQVHTTQSYFKLLVMVHRVWLSSQPSSPLKLVPREESVKLADEPMPSACCGVPGSIFPMGQEEDIQL